MISRADCSIRRERPEDREAVFALNTSAFERSDEARLVDELRAGVEPYLAYVARVGEEIVGFIASTPVTILDAPSVLDGSLIDETPLFFGLGPMSVAPEHQRCGIGGRLIDRGLHACRDLGAGAVFVLGHPGYYPRFGFVPAADNGFYYESEHYAPYFFVLELREGALLGGSRRVVYSPPFDSV